MTSTCRRSNEEEFSRHLLRNQKSVINQPLRPIPSHCSATFSHHFVTLCVEQPHWKHNLVTCHHHIITRWIRSVNYFAPSAVPRNTEVASSSCFSTTSAPRVRWSSYDSPNVQNITRFFSPSCYPLPSGPDLRVSVVILRRRVQLLTPCAVALPSLMLADQIFTRCSLIFLE